MVSLGEKIPVFDIQATSGLHGSSQQFLGHWLILYFYPKDATPGCTTQGCNFRDQNLAFKDLNATVLGLSRDSLKSHEKFKAAQGFPFELVSDPDEHICQLFDVMKSKSMYGKKVRGIERSTFLIDPNGVLRYEWRKVDVEGHVMAVYNKLQSLINEYPNVA